MTDPFYPQPSRWAKADLEALKAANPIEDVARDLGLVVTHHRIKCPMPGRHTHGDRTPSVTLWPERGLFKCWVCPDVKGDAIALVRLIQGTGFAEAIRWLQSRSGMAFTSGTRSETQGSAAQPRATQARPTPSSAADAGSEIPRGVPAVTTAPDPERSVILKKLFELAAPISGPAAKYLQSRRIFKRTWEKQGLRWIDHYARISSDLVEAFGLPALQQHGLFNADGHFRYYRHVLLFPYFDLKGDPVYLQARAVQATVTPKELSLAGPIPLPYNIAALKQGKRHVYLCEGVVDTLTMLEQGMAALGVPGASNFKPEWVPLFLDHVMHIVFDPDAAGEAGAHRVEALLAEAGISARRIPLPPGKDINDWLRSGGLVKPE
jgi:DNA primase